MWQVSRQSSDECPSDMRQNRPMLRGTGDSEEALAAEMAAFWTRFFIAVLTESALTLFTGEIIRDFCLRLPRADGESSRSGL